MAQESNYADKAYHEKVSQQVALTTGRQIEGISNTVTESATVLNNENLSTSTKSAAVALNVANAGIQAFGAVNLLVDNALGGALMPMLEGMGMKGSACLPISKELDPVLGIDIHMVTLPPSGPAPIPMPHPYIGMLFRPKDFLAAAIASYLPPPPSPPEMSDTSTEAEPSDANVVQAKTLAHTAATMIIGMIGATVKIGGFTPRAVASTPTKNIPHFPMGTGFHPVYSRLCSKNNGHALFGSLLALADADPISGGGAHLHNSCQDLGIFSPHTMRPTKNKADGIKMGLQLFLPTGTIVPIPTLGTIITNPVPAPFNPMMLVRKLLTATLGKFVSRKLHKKIDKRVNPGRLNNMLHRAICTVTGHPVDVATGNFFTDEEDFFLPAPVPLSWERVYYSNSHYQGPLGNGWHHAYDIVMIQDNDTQTVSIRLADGRPVAFETPTPQTPSFNKAEQLELFIDDNNRLCLWNLKDDVYYHFTPQTYNELHLLHTVSDRNGFALRLEYNANGHLIKITDAAHRELAVSNDRAGRITTITAPHPTEANQTFAIASYEYDAEGNLIKQTNAEGDSMLFEYRGRLMVKETWRNGFSWYFEYDSAEIGARCIHTWGDKNIYNHKLAFEPGKTTVTNSLGHNTQYYHANGLVYKRIDPNGAEHQWLYDDDNQMLSETDPLGNAYLYAYDKWGNQTQTTNPMGGTQNTEYAFRHKNKPESVQTPLGGTWKWKYDAHGNAVEVINPNNASTKIEYSDGLPHLITDYLGNQTVLEYDAGYNLTRVTEPTGAVTQYEYDILGRNIATQNAKNARQQLFYDLLGRVTQVTDFDGNRIALQYDGIDNLLHYRDVHTEVNYTYDGMWKMTGRNQHGKNIRFGYNTEEELTSVETNDAPYRMIRDQVGNVVKEIPFDQVARNYTYDLAGNMTGKAVTNHDGALSRDTQTLYEYNKLGNICKITYHDGVEHRFDYNPAGLLTTAATPQSEVTFAYNTLGNITCQTQNGISITNTYNAVGQRVHLQSGMGDDIRFEHNALGQLAQMAAAAQPHSTQWQAAFGYDQMGLEIQRLLPGNLQHTTTRDALGRPTQLATAQTGKNTRTRKYLWGINDRLKQIIHHTAGATTFEYDPAGYLTQAVYPDGQRQNRYPDNKNNLYQTPQCKDREYETGGKLIKKGNLHYRYDHLGNLVEKYKKNGALFASKQNRYTYAWNSAGMLEKVTRPDGETVTFAYDALGRRLSKQFKGTKTLFLWDNNVPLHQWKESVRSVFNDGREHKTLVTHSHTTWLFEPESFVPCGKIKDGKSYSIITDHLGTPTEGYDDAGTLIWERELDTNGKTRMLKGDEGFCNFTFQGQEYDKDIDLSYNRFRWFSAEDGIYISQDPIGLASGEFGFYNYVHDTNTWIDVFGLKQSVYVLKKKGEIVYVGITNNPKTRKKAHKNKKGKNSFDEMVVIAEFDTGNDKKDRVKARNLEGSALDQANGQLDLNATRLDGKHYHSYDPKNLQDGRTYINDIDLDNLAKSGITIK